MEESLLSLLDTPLFSGITAQQLPALMSCLRAEAKHFTKGEAILAVGDHATHVGVLLNGHAQVVEDDFEGNRTIVTELSSGDLYCETFACARITSIPISVIAIDDVDTLLIDYSLIINTCSIACDFHNLLLENMMAVLAEKNLALNSKLRHIGKRSLREKLFSYLSEQAQRKNSTSFTISFNRQELADYLCADRSALSAELSRMQADGLIQYHRNDFTLLCDF